MKEKRPQFAASQYESTLIYKLAQRASALAQSYHLEYPIQKAWMDIEATHCSGCPLDLAELLKANNGDFGHDVFGIRRHIDRSTGELTGCFVPRYAIHQ